MHDPNGDYAKAWFIVACAGVSLAIAMAVSIAAQNWMNSL